MIKQITESSIYRIPGRIFVQEQIEADIPGPLDSRTLVPTYKDLINPGWWTYGYLDVLHGSTSARLLLYKGMVVEVQDESTLYVYTGDDCYLYRGDTAQQKSLVAAGKWRKITYGLDDDITWPLRFSGDTLGAAVSVNNGYSFTYAQTVTDEHSGNLYVGKDFVSLGSNGALSASESDDTGSDGDAEGGTVVSASALVFQPDSLSDVNGRGLYVPSSMLQSTSKIAQADSTSGKTGLRAVKDEKFTLLSGNGTGLRIKDNSTAISMSDNIMTVDSSVIDSSTLDFYIHRKAGTKSFSEIFEMNKDGFKLGVYDTAAKGVWITANSDVSVNTTGKFQICQGNVKNTYTSTYIDLRTTKSRVYVADDVSVDTSVFISKCSVFDVSTGAVELIVKPEEYSLGYDKNGSAGGMKMYVNDSDYTYMDVSASDVSIFSEVYPLTLSGKDVKIASMDTSLYLWGDYMDESKYVLFKSPVDGTDAMAKIPYYVNGDKDASVGWYGLTKGQGASIMYSNSAGLLQQLSAGSKTGLFYAQDGTMTFLVPDKTVKMVLQWNGSKLEWTDQLFGSKMGIYANYLTYGNSNYNSYTHGVMYENASDPIYITSEEGDGTKAVGDVAKGKRKQYVKVATYTAVVNMTTGVWKDMQLVLSVSGRENAGVYAVDARFANCSQSKALGITTDSTLYRGYARIRQYADSTIMYDNAPINRSPEVIGTIEYFKGDDEISFDSIKRSNASTEAPYKMVFTLFIGVNDAQCSWNVLSKQMQGDEKFDSLEITSEEDIANNDDRYDHMYGGDYFSDFALDKVKAGTGEFAFVEKSLAINYGRFTQSDTTDWEDRLDAYSDFWSNYNVGSGLCDIPAPPTTAGQSYGLVYYPAESATVDASFGWENFKTKTVKITETGISQAEDPQIKLLGAYVPDGASFDGGITDTYFSDSVYFTKDGNMYATAYYALSDAREKENIDSVADDLIGIQPKQFDYKETGRHAYGFIAQELEEAHPELVSTTADGMKRVDYNSALTLYAAQLEKKIQVLEQRLSALEAKLGE